MLPTVENIHSCAHIATIRRRNQQCAPNRRFFHGGHRRQGVAMHACLCFEPDPRIWAVLLGRKPQRPDPDGSNSLLEPRGPCLAHFDPCYRLMAFRGSGLGTCPLMVRPGGTVREPACPRPACPGHSASFPFASVVRTSGESGAGRSLRGRVLFFLFVR